MLLKLKKNVKEIFDGLQSLANSHIATLHKMSLDNEFEPDEYFEHSAFEAQHEEDDDEIDEEDFDDEDDKSSDEDFPEYDIDDLATIYYEYKPRFSQKKEPTEDFTRLLDKWEEILQREDVKVSVWNNPEKIPVWEGKDDAGTRQTNFEYKTPQKDAILKFDCGRVYGLNSKYTNECFLKVSYQKGERKIEGSVSMLYPSGFTGSEAAFKLSVGNLLAHIGRTDLAKLVAKFQAKKMPKMQNAKEGKKNSKSKNGNKSNASKTNLKMISIICNKPSVKDSRNKNYIRVIFVFNENFPSENSLFAYPTHTPLVSFALVEIIYSPLSRLVHPVWQYLQKSLPRRRRRTPFVFGVI